MSTQRIAAKNSGSAGACRLVAKIRSTAFWPSPGFARSLLLLVLLQMPWPAAAATIETGAIPPDYLGRSTDGEAVYLSKLDGRIRIVSFWATWCGPCRKELPVLNAIQKQAGADRVQVIAINLEEPRKQFRRAMKAYKEFEITFVHDKQGIVARQYGVKGIPFMVIIDVDGRIAYQHTGYSEGALGGIVEEINSLLLKNNLASANQ